MTRFERNLTSLRFSHLNWLVNAAISLRMLIPGQIFLWDGRSSKSITEKAGTNLEQRVRPILIN